jgi:adenine-specific DNA-methyltransferase
MMTTPETGAMVTDLVMRAERRRVEVGGRIEIGVQRQLGQFFTPLEVAVKIAAQPRLDQADRISVLDPGAGVGMLTVALVARIFQERPDLAVTVAAVELDESLHLPLREALADCQQVASAIGIHFDYEIVEADFISWGIDHATGSLDVPLPERRFDVVIQNPPYGKVKRVSPVRRNLSILSREALLALSSSPVSSRGLTHVDT